MLTKEQAVDLLKNLICSGDMPPHTAISDIQDIISLLQQNPAQEPKRKPVSITSCVVGLVIVTQAIYDDGTIYEKRSNLDNSQNHYWSKTNRITQD